MRKKADERWGFRFLLFWNQDYKTRWVWPMALLLTALSSSRSTSDELARRWQRIKRGLSLEGHIPEIGVPTFRRDAVESTPLHVSDRSSLQQDDFGSRSLPLRAAVETKPDIIASTRRIPLKDAVQSIPFHSTFDDNHYIEQSTEFRRPEYHPQYRPIFLQQPYNYLRSQLSPQGQYAISTGFINPNYYVGQTYYQPLQQFQSMVADYGSAAQPYRIDNEHQQLLYGFSPYNHIYSDGNYRVGRSRKEDVKEGMNLYGNHPFLRSKYGDALKEIDPELEEEEFGTKKVICYIQAAAVYRRQPLTFTPEDLDPNLCTHVIYAFATVDPHTFRLVPNDEEYDAVQGGYLSITGLKLKNPNLKVLISIGGGRKDMAHRFQQLISSSVNRQIFIKSVIDFLDKYNFDGIDLHWHSPGYEEYGGTRSDREQLALLLEELSEVIRPLGRLLTVAAPASRFRIEDGFQPQRLGEVVDWVHVQAYDFHNDRNLGHTTNNPDTNLTYLADHHSPLYTRTEDTGLDIFFSVDYSVRYWLKRGLPKHKLILGIPLFGRTFTLDDVEFDGSGAGRRRYTVIGPGREGYYTQHPGFLAYYEICELLINRRLHRYVDSSDSPYISYEDQWVGYDDPESIDNKLTYVKDMGLGGVFVWAADLDDFRGLCGDKWPVLATIKRNLLDINISPSDGWKLMKKERYGGFKTMWEAVGPVQVNYMDKVSGRWNDRAKEAVKMPRVVCYLTNWAFYRKAEGKFVPEHVDQRLCTHVVYAFASLDAENLIMKEFDPWADLDNNLYSRVTGLRDTTVLLSLGGWTDSAGGKYSRLVGDGDARRKFVLGAVAFLRRYHFRGLHFDWNYPVCWQSNCRKGPATDRPNFTKLIQELRTEFDKQSPPLELAIAISGYKEVIDDAYELAALGRAVDFLSVMTYDYHGSWEGVTGHVSPLYERPGDKYPQYNTNFTMEYLVSRGAPREKLLLGVPFYGQTFTLAVHDGDYDVGARTSGPGTEGEYTRQPGMLAYYEICGRVRNQRWMVDRQGGATYAFNRDQWVGYDDVENIEFKGKYIKAQGFGGAVAWTIDLDDFGNRCCGGTYPLLHGLNRGLGRISDNGVQKHTVGDCTRPPEPVTPPAPTLTTGVDTGAAVSPSTDSSWGETTNRPTESTPWWTPEKTTTTTTQRTTTTRRTTTTKRTPAPTTPSTTPPWWTQGTTIPPPGIIMPEIEKPGQSEQCEPGTYKADPHNCNSYYRCVLGELKKNYCAGGLHWNNERSSCDWPANANCQEKPNEDHQHVELPTTSTTTTRKPITVDYNPILDDAMPSSCTNGYYYPHEECNSFYVCVNGQLIRQQCAPGLQWSVEDMACDWKHRIKCTGRRKLAMSYMWEKWGYLVEDVRSDAGKEPYEACDAGSASFAAYRGDCTQYLICMWNKYEPFQCAPGLHWNAEQKICDWPNNAKCSWDSGAEPPPPGGGEPPKPVTPKPTVKPPAPVVTTVAPPTVITEPLPTHSGYFKVVCYFTNWAWYRRGLGKYTPENINADLCTHIVYGFAVLDYENLVIKAHDSWADFDNKFYERVTDFKSKGLKVTLAIGGWNDSQGDKYSRLVNNPAARERFIKNVIEFLEKYNFDGLDLDWEYPKCWQVDCNKGPSSDKPAFAAWVRELKAAFAPRKLLLSAAVSPSKTVIDAGYDVPSLAKDLDWIAVMTYDFHGQWDKKTGHVAPLYEHPDDDVTFFNANYSINYWISEGVPRRKIIMGMPLYGQSFQLEREVNHGLNAPAPGPGQAGEFTRAAGFLAHYEICDKVRNEGWTVVHDEKHRMGPYAYKGNQWVSYDDQPMIALKSEYIRRMDLGGGMIWALDLDDFTNRCGEGKHPLLSTIRRILAAPGVEGVVLETPAVPTIEGDTGTIISEDEQIHHSTPSTVTVPSREEEVSSGGGALVVPPLGGAPAGKDDYKVVCYFTNWAWYRQGVGKYTPENIDPDLCTHIVYGFAVLNGDQLVIKPHDSWADFDNKFYEKVTALRAKGIKVLIAIGGWNDSAGDKYSKLVNNPAARRRFIAHVVDFIRDNNFDGLDLDWEYPKCWQVDCKKGPSSDKSAFAAWVSELRESFAPHGWLLSAAVSPSRRVIDAGYDVQSLSRDLDWIAVMCYDYHGQWDKVTGHVAPMYAHPDDADVTFNTNFTIHYWIELGADRRKLVLGMPTYGQSFSLADVKDAGLNAPTYGGGEAGDETRARGFLAYYEICANVMRKGWSVVQDRKGRIGPYAHKGDQWVSYDDQAMIRHKAEYVRAMGLGGGMIWALDLDDFRDICECEEYPLLRTINRILRGYNKYPEMDCTLGGPPPQGHQTTPTKTPPIQHTEEADISNNDLDQSPPPPPSYQPDIIEISTDADTSEMCSGGSLFEPHPTNCEQYYMCNQGHKELYSCPGGLYWNHDRCDWPVNTPCKVGEVQPVRPQVTTTTSTTTRRPPRPVKPAVEGEYKVVCYFTNWAWYRQGDGKYLPSDIDTDLCTHITYGFAVLDGSTLTIKPHDSWADIDNEFYKKVVALQSKGVKVLIAIGGWNDSLGDKYSRLVNDPAARAKFIEHVLLFIDEWGFDGLDLDWEYPKCWQVDCEKGPDSDKPSFAAWVRELSAAFKPRGLLLSTAVSPSKMVIDAGYDVPSLSRDFDWIAVMTYDFHGHWDKKTGHVAPLYYYPGDTYQYFNANFSLNYWIEKGADRKKIIMGMPLYGQSFSLADSKEHGLNAPSYGPGEAGDFTRAGGFLAFYEICERVKRRSWQVVRDPLGRIGPYAYSGQQWVGYDDVAEIRRKSGLVKELGLGGGMVWALDLDDFRNRCGCGRHPLLRTLSYELNGSPPNPPTVDCT